MDHRVPWQVLIGVLAVQKGLVSQSALVDTFSLWVGARHRALADVLISQRLLDPTQRDHLLNFAEQHRRASGDDLVAALHRLHNYAEIQATLMELAAADANATALQPGGSANDRVRGDNDPSSDSARSETTGVRFVVITPLAHGGLGSISIARDLAMRLIRGNSLKKAISGFHAARQSGASGFESLAFRSNTQIAMCLL